MRSTACSRRRWGVPPPLPPPPHLLPAPAACGGQGYLISSLLNQHRTAYPRRASPPTHTHTRAHAHTRTHRGPLFPVPTVLCSKGLCCVCDQLGRPGLPAPPTCHKETQKRGAPSWPPSYCVPVVPACRAFAGWLAPVVPWGARAACGQRLPRVIDWRRWRWRWQRGACAGWRSAQHRLNGGGPLVQCFSHPPDAQLCKGRAV